MAYSHVGYLNERQGGLGEGQGPIDAHKREGRATNGRSVLGNVVSYPNDGVGGANEPALFAMLSMSCCAEDFSSERSFGPMIAFHLSGRLPIGTKHAVCAQGTSLTALPDFVSFIAGSNSHEPGLR